MRVDSILHICQALGVRPDDLLTENVKECRLQEEELFERLERCFPRDKDTALRLLSVFLDSLQERESRNTKEQF